METTKQLLYYYNNRCAYSVISLTPTATTAKIHERCSIMAGKLESGSPKHLFLNTLRDQLVNLQSRQAYDNHHCLTCKLCGPAILNAFSANRNAPQQPRQCEPQQPTPEQPPTPKLTKITQTDVTGEHIAHDARRLVRLEKVNEDLRQDRDSYRTEYEALKSEHEKVLAENDEEIAKLGSKDAGDGSEAGSEAGEEESSEDDSADDPSSRKRRRTKESSGDGRESLGHIPVDQWDDFDRELFGVDKRASPIAKLELLDQLVLGEFQPSETEGPEGARVASSSKGRQSKLTDELKEKPMKLEESDSEIEVYEVPALVKKPRRLTTSTIPVDKWSKQNRSNHKAKQSRTEKEQREFNKKDALRAKATYWEKAGLTPVQALAKAITRTPKEQMPKKDVLDKLEKLAEAKGEAQKAKNSKKEAKKSKN